MTQPRSTFAKYMPWVVYSLGCLFYFYESLLSVSLSVMSTELMRDFAITSQMLGLLSGVYFYSYSAMQLPGGMLLDYFGPRRLLTIATTLCAVSTIAFGLTDHFFMACVTRALIGFGSAFAVIGTLKLAVNWFSSDKFVLLTGVMVTIGMLGGIGGEGPLAKLIEVCGWRESMLIMGGIGLIIALLIFFVTKDAPAHLIAQANDAEEVQEEPLIRSLFALFKNKQLWLVALYGGLMYMATPVFCSLWGVSFLMLKMHIAKTAAANSISMVFVGWAIASPLGGLFSNRLGLRKPALYIACLGALATSLGFIYLPINSMWIMNTLLLCFGLFSAFFLPAFAVAKELVNKRYVATGLSFMNMMNMLGIALVQPVIGYILDKLWGGELVDSARVYPIEAYQKALVLLPGAMLIALFILPLIRETYCKNMQD